jgi:PAS domain S-box-containing protein
MDARATDVPIYLETVRVNRDGRELEVGLTVSPMRTEQGVFIGHSVIARDISERRQAERKFELAVESSASAMIMVDALGKIVLVNAETERQFGYRRDELVGSPIEQLVPQRFRAEHPAFRNAFESRPTSRAMGAGRELFGLRRDGTEFPIEIGLNPIPTPQGYFVLASILDVTERKQAEQRFRLAVEASPNGIAMVDSTGKILLVNAETSRMFGYPSEDMTGMPIDLLVPARFRGQHRLHRDGFHAEPQKRVMGSGRDLYGMRKDGTEFPVEIGLNPIETPDGMVVLSTIVDITERKLAERALARQTAELERSNADLEQFAYVASHDLQEPLRMVASYTDLLAENYASQLDEKAHRFIGYAQDGAARMRRLIDDLLAYSRVRTLRAKPHPVNSQACLQHALQNLALSIREADAQVEYATLPAVLADETQLTEVFQNLVHNAIKFRRTENPVVQVRANVQGGLCTFSVSDNGIGVPPDQHERIFQVFQRLHTREEYPGTGIGLALCKRVVEQYGGAIGIEPHEGPGTTVVFSFPSA